jgi:hypothetical protein
MSFTLAFDDPHRYIWVAQVSAIKMKNDFLFWKLGFLNANLVKTYFVSHDNTPVQTKIDVNNNAMTLHPIKSSRFCAGVLGQNSGLFIP